MNIIYLWWFLAVVIGSIITGVLRGILDIEKTSPFKYGVLIYDIIDTIVSISIGYLIMSAIAGHYLK